MTLGHLNVGSASANNGRVRRVKGARLITILLQELLHLLNEICTIYSHGGTQGAVDQQVMALSLVDSLIESLDMDNGGHLSQNLERIYQQVRRLIGSDDPANQLKNNRAAHQVILEIHTAWSEGQRG